MTSAHCTLSVFVVCLAACSSVSPPRQVPSTEDQDPELARIIDPIVAKRLAELPAAGISVAVARHDRIVFARGYGLASLEAGTPATARTSYRIASVTKQFTAAAIMQLVEQGRIGLDEPITTYLPDYPTHGATITVRHLLTHTSGIPNYTDAAWITEGAATTVTLAQLIDRFAARPLDFAPGTSWSYSNSGYILLGAIVERVSGRPYASYMRERVLAPLGLDATHACDDRPLGPEVASGYTISAEGQLVPAPAVSMSEVFSAGALCSTATDLARWTAALHRHQAVSAASYLQMTTPVSLGDGKWYPYGFGLSVDQLDGHPVVHHLGGIMGFGSKVAYYPEDDLTVVVLINMDGGGADGTEDLMARALLGLPTTRIEEAPLDPAEASLYTGVFAVPGLELELFFTYAHTRGRLLGKTSVADPWQSLVHQGGGRFVSASNHDHLVTFDPATGRGARAERLTLCIDGTCSQGQRR